MAALMLFGASVLANPVMAVTAEERGLEISVEAKNRDLGWGDMSAQMEMILRNKEGQMSHRQIRLKSLEQDNDGDKSLTIFDQPLDVKGTAFLSFSHINKADDQWLYLPALKRVKRISSRNKSGPFMGSEFAFEDLTSFEVEKYSYKYLRDEPFDGQDSFVVEQYPTDKYSGYTRRVVWLDKEHYRVLKVDFYDRKDSLLKTLEFKEYKQYLDQYWRADRSLMTNHQTGKSTELVYSDYQFQVGLKKSDFNKNSLKRAR
ncbi:outer membrane lipoprotein-sorting protein [Motiliproteus coralliicola]|uniref:Outer membrane lipoprotein-sorting protein n=1 Tax=Motiliproteus coralliicola TaxID=2283196 RepID=A0A369WEZ4_9GAMM|nr:outer membrane lipoprotein-sorting protein [Motiliproteus coralliicola]